MGKRIGFFISDPKWKNYQRWTYNAAKALYSEGYDVVVIASGKSRLYTRLKGYGIQTIRFNKSGFLLWDVKQLSKTCKRYGVDNLVINHPGDIRIATLTTRNHTLDKLVFRRGTIPVKSKNALDSYLARNYITTVITNSKANKQAINCSQSSIFKDLPVEVVYNGIQDKSLETNIEGVDYHHNGELIVGLSNCAANRTFCKRFFEYVKEAGIDKEEVKFLIFPDWKRGSSFYGEIKQISLNGVVRFSNQERRLSEFMSKVDVYLSPVVENSFNYSLIYAMAQRKPVIGFRGGSNPEIIGDHENGFLVKENNFDGLIQKIEALKDDNLREKMGEKAFQTIQHTFNYRHSANQLRRIFNTAG
jgi:glycosyltransferase involved in cell wall biosynthesis